MESRQEERLDSLRETGEKLIKDAEYHDATAKGIRDQVNDFGTCWKDITESIKERKAMVSDVIDLDLPIIFTSILRVFLSNRQSMNVLTTVWHESGSLFLIRELAIGVIFCVLRELSFAIRSDWFFLLEAGFIAKERKSRANH